MEPIKDELSTDWKSLLPEVYRDVAKPSAIKIGKALSSIVGIVATPVGKGCEILEKNLEKLADKLDKVDSEKITSAPPELAVPILERLKYTRGDELVNLYIELFVKSANIDTQEEAYPSFFEIITNLSVDEAKILEYYHYNEGGNFYVLPYLRIKIKTKGEKGDIIWFKYFNLLSDKISFHIKDQEERYIENLLRLGFFEDLGNRYLTEEEKFYKPLLESSKLKKIQENFNGTNKELAIEKSYLQITSFGEKFLSVCMPPKTNRQ